MDIVIPNIDSTHDTCEEVKPPRFLEATRIENELYQAMESLSPNVQLSKRQMKPTRRYNEECDYVVYALTVASG